MASQARARYQPRPTKGDERREQLLVTLRELVEAKPLAEIGIAEITKAAGVTRSAFYFYFPTKAAAVAAMLADLREEIVEAGSAWYAGSGEPTRRVRAAVDGSVRLWRQQAGLMTAMFDAAAQDLEVRQAWQAWVDEFVARIAARIEQDRDAGLIHAESRAYALATVLMGATVHGMEQDVRAIAAGREALADLPEALAELWYRTLYA